MLVTCCRGRCTYVYVHILNLLKVRCSERNQPRTPCPLKWQGVIFWLSAWCRRKSAANMWTVGDGRFEIHRTKMSFLFPQIQNKHLCLFVHCKCLIKQTGCDSLFLGMLLLSPPSCPGGYVTFTTHLMSRRTSLSCITKIPNWETRNLSSVTLDVKRDDPSLFPTAVREWK